MRRCGYTHHGLGIGNGEVIHCRDLANGLEFGSISKVTLEGFSNGLNTIANIVEKRSGNLWFIGFLLLILRGVG